VDDLARSIFGWLCPGCGDTANSHGRDNPVARHANSNVALFANANYFTAITGGALGGHCQPDGNDVGGIVTTDADALSGTDLIQPTCAQ